MSAVETVRDIPLIIEYEKEEPMDYEVQSGFPFDRHNRDGSFRDQLEDIAKRHPEFADHLLNFKQRGFREKPQGRSFDTFDKWGFPEDFPEEQFFRERFEPRRQSFTRSGPSSHEAYNTQQAGGSQQEPAQQQYYQQQQAGPAQEAPAGQEQQQHRDEQEQPQEIGRAKNNIQQSNTVDLGQKSEPVNERNQRSMSAPPENRQRFVSSINIPVGRDAGAGDNPQQPHDQQQPKQHGNVTERVIPIHVEGRDDPVMPRHANATFSQPERVFRPDPEPVFAHRPEPERIFGQRPEHFTQFVHEPRGFERDAWHDPFERYPEEFFGKRGFQQQHRGSPQQQQQQQHQQQQPKQQQHYQQPPHSQQQQHYQQAPPQQQQQHYQQPPPQQQQQQSTQQPTQQQEAPQPKPQQNKPLTPMEKIQVVQKDVADLMEKVEKFEGVKKDKYYLYLDEMLTRNLIALDDIDTQGQDTIRTARKEAIKCIQKAISVLENKATDPNAPKVEESTEKMEVEEKPQETESSQMEAEVAASENKAEEGSTADTKEESKMEVAEKPVEDVAEEKKELKEEPSAVPVETKGDEKPAEVQQEEANIVEENTAKVSDTIQKFENKEGEGKSEEKSSELSSEKTDEVKTVESAEEKPAEAKDATEETTDKAKDEKKEKKKTKKKAEKKE